MASRKHFRAIAEAFRANAERIREGDTPEDVLRRTASDVAITLNATNPRFDRVRFMRACGVLKEDS